MIFAVFGCQADDRVLLRCEGSMAVGDTLMFPDGASLELLSIEDTRCPCDVFCITSGPLTVTLGDGATTLRLADFPYGEELPDKVTYRGFTISLARTGSVARGCAYSDAPLTCVSLDIQ